MQCEGIVSYEYLDFKATFAAAAAAAAEIFVNLLPIRLEILHCILKTLLCKSSFKMSFQHQF
jgi:hypothetical protein